MSSRFFVALGATALLFVPDIAHACTAPLCTGSTVPRGGNLPSNAIAIPYLPGSGAPTFKLVDGAGADIATTVKSDPWSGGQLLVPTKALPAGKVDLVFAETCGGPGGEQRKSFSVGSDVALPNAVGTLKAVNRAVGDITVSTSSGSCINHVQAVTFDLQIDPTNELRAYREVISYRVAVDGEDMIWPGYGSSVEADDGPLTFARIHAVCSDRKAGDNNGPPLGIHTLSVKAHVAGATTDPPPALLAINLSCTDATQPEQPKSAVDVPTSTPSPHVDPPPSNAPAASSPAAPAPNSASDDTSGCNASRSSTGSPFALLALAGFVTWLRRKAAGPRASRAASRTK